MSLPLMYFFKVNIAIALFYLMYRLFFNKDTFWEVRRYYLLFSVLLSFAYPLISIGNWFFKQEAVNSMIAKFALLPEMTVGAVQHSTIFSFENFALIIYGFGVFILLIRMLIQLTSILHIRFRNKNQLVQGKSIIVLENEITPFSFFGWVFLNPALHNEHEISEILAHELTHVRQGHSFDVIISEMLTILCWFNPFTWLLKNEIRQNLEFLADNQVIESGFNSKNYQYHLLQLSFQSPQFNLGNKFNVSPLKKRITMMNQQKTSKAGLLKYLIIAPLALALILSSNAETIFNRANESLGSNNLMRQTSKIIDNRQNAQQADNNTISNSETILQQVSVNKNVRQAATAILGTTDPNKTDNDKVFQVVEKMPEFPGGIQMLMKYLSQNIKYPVEAQKLGIEGKVFCQFVITKEGKVGNVNVIRSVHPSLDAEAVRVIKDMPVWTPGEQKGEKVNVQYVLPINFNSDFLTP
jgi:TonB family protein